MKMNVKVSASKITHEVFTNGTMQILGKNHFQIDFPRYFNASSIYFHLLPAGSRQQISYFYTSISGKQIPIIVYGKKDLKKFLDRTVMIMSELENDFGPWPHEKLLILVNRWGGMEYSGATYTTYKALGHELFHSYFGRATMPANGNAGWFDEAAASWWDHGYPNYKLMDLKASGLSAHSVYRRDTDKRSYKNGRMFLGYLDFLFQEQGGLRPFLRHWFAVKKFIPYTSLDLQREMESYFKTDLSDLFSTYINGKKF